jgi:hypothetical protein
MWGLVTSIFFLQWLKTEAACPLGQTEFANHCYVLSMNKVAWFEAERVCEGAGSFLTSVENGFERSALQSQSRNFAYLECPLLALVRDASFSIDAVWIGGTNVNDLVHWEWIDGSNFTFQQWKPGEQFNPRITRCQVTPKTIRRRTASPSTASPACI